MLASTLYTDDLCCVISEIIQSKLLFLNSRCAFVLNGAEHNREWSESAESAVSYIFPSNIWQELLRTTQTTTASYD